MEFTLTFVKIYTFGLWLAAPLLLSFIAAIVALGLFVGKKESWSKLDSLYWAFITATTVGYGDIRPLQKLSRFLSIMIAFIGLIFTGIMVALAINAATVTFSHLHDVEKVQKEIERLK
ncbi:potassium channel family protein [Kaarinaea lacus]